MTIHILVEGPSERAFLESWAKRLLKDVPFRVHPHEGKGSLPRNEKAAAKPDPKRRGLLDQLPAKIRAFASSLKTDDSVLVLVDADDEDPDELRRQLDSIMAKSEGLHGAVALAVEETEAFYLGDLSALKRTYPDADMNTASGYLPDSICGTWELFGKIIQDDGENKVMWAAAMGPVVTTDPARSRSPSFKRFIAALSKLRPRPPAQPARRRYRHPAADRKDGSGRR